MSGNPADNAKANDMNGTIYINPNDSADVEFMTREWAKEHGVRVMPSHPFPWNRKAYKAIKLQESARVK